LKFNWLTEITHLKHHQYFIDEQRFGPYKLWHHEHHFTVVEGGVMMHDILTYDVGKSIFGWLASKLFVDKQVQEIFDHRYTTLEKIFGKA
jgi:ligand-binding SRPBCC domain-containing protein